MFDAPELDQMVYRLLDRRPLLLCAQVNRQWSNAVGSFIWQRIPESMSSCCWRLFYQLVLEDYLQAISQPQSHRPATGLRRSTRIHQMQSSEQREQIGPLSRYGHCVRQVEDFALLLESLEPEPRWSPLTVVDYWGPSATDLARHFLKRCPNALISFQMTHQHVSSDKLFRLSLEVLPKVNILGIQSNKDHGKTDFSIRKLKRMIAAASENLHSLTIAILKFRANMCNTGASTIPPTPVITARPKRLIIRAFGDKDQVVEDWSWLWGACGQLKEIELCYVANSIIESLAKAIRNWMPCLDSVSFSDARPYWTLDYIPDSNIASILAAGTKGWKVVQCHYEAEVGSQTFDALLQHFETLEQFVVSRADDSTGIMRVLKSCPHLRVLETIGSENDDHRPLSIHATDFIDRDPASGTYRPWPCTRTLETLTITIVDIPVHYPSLIDEDDEQRTLEIQRRVCERLGQFTNLKILRLGHLRYGLDGIMCPSMFLALTLDTGMEKLGGLDKLQELYINYNHHLIDGELEVKWMAENWRKLRKVRGLRRHTAAYKWINKSIHQINLL